MSQLQVNDPSVLLHVALPWQLWVPDVHSLLSVNLVHKQWKFKNHFLGIRKKSHKQILFNIQFCNIEFSRNEKCLQAIENKLLNEKDSAYILSICTFYPIYIVSGITCANIWSIGSGSSLIAMAFINNRRTLVATSELSAVMYKINSNQLDARR